jgi:ADP-ribose pyrophosphatase YjhB (NUDIX family)
VSHDDDLSAYPRPSVAVDIAVLTVQPTRSSGDSPAGQLAVLVQDRLLDPPGRSLPGRFLRDRQRVAEAVTDVLHLKVGLRVRLPAPHLLRVFDNPARDERGWTLSLAHALALPYATVAAGSGELVGVGLAGELTSRESLLFDHDMIVAEAAHAIRERYERGPDPDGLLAEDFTLAELRALHEAVLGERLRKDTFNRRMLEQLNPVGDSDAPMTRSRGGRPAQVYVRASDWTLSPTAQRRLQLPRDTR